MAPLRRIGCRLCDIPGANASKYLLVAADAGRTMRVTVTANSVGSSSATSAPSAVIRQRGG